MNLTYSEISKIINEIDDQFTNHICCDEGGFLQSASVNYESKQDFLLAMRDYFCKNFTQKNYWYVDCNGVVKNTSDLEDCFRFEIQNHVNWLKLSVIVKDTGEVVAEADAYEDINDLYKVVVGP